MGNSKAADGDLLRFDAVPSPAGLDSRFDLAPLRGRSNDTRRSREVTFFTWDERVLHVV